MPAMVEIVDIPLYVIYEHLVLRRSRSIPSFLRRDSHSYSPRKY